MAPSRATTTRRKPSRYGSVAVAAVLFVALAACSKDDTTKPKPGDEQASKNKDEHAASGVAPGSHDDWCGEHAVHESQCSRCNPELTAAFKATGDWCEEHGVPESQCLQCNPDLKIVRPGPAASAETEE